MRIITLKPKLHYWGRIPPSKFTFLLDIGTYPARIRTRNRRVLILVYFLALSNLGSDNKNFINSHFTNNMLAKFYYCP